MSKISPLRFAKSAQNRTQIRRITQAAQKARQSHVPVAAAVVIGGTAALLAYSYANPVRADTKVDDLGKSDYSQHIQVSHSWDNPGVYVWGSNKFGVGDPKSADAYVKTATRLSFFDGMALRDLAVAEEIGVAVLENGDIVQWGHNYNGIPVKRKRGVPIEQQDPEVTLKGKKIRSVKIGRDVIYALSKSGSVYVLPLSKQDQIDGPKAVESSWIPFASGRSQISYHTITPSLASGETFSEIAAGLDHVLLLTNRGRVFSSTPNNRGNERGQMGLLDLTHETVAPQNEYKAFEIEGLSRIKATKIAAGEHHSIAMSSEGEVFSFGANQYGQLGFDFGPDSNNVASPTMVGVQSLYPRNYRVKCQHIAAGGKNSYMVIENSQYGKPNSSRIDVWAVGMGQFGQLGNNTWNHYQSKPVKVRTISGLSEWSEAENKVVPIDVYMLSVGGSHTICCLDNYSHVAAEASTDRYSKHDVNYGRDVFVWYAFIDARHS